MSIFSCLLRGIDCFPCCSPSSSPGDKRDVLICSKLPDWLAVNLTASHKTAGNSLLSQSEIPLFGDVRELGRL